MGTTEVVANCDYVKLVVRRMYDAQKLRMQSDLRLQRLVREGLVLKEDAERVFTKAQEYEVKAEKEYERIVWREIKNMPVVVQWLSRVKGIGPRLGGLLVANIGDIGRFPNVAKLWAYCGLNPVDGKARRRAKGEKANWSSELKTTCWKISQSFVKAGGPYRELYDRYKKRITAREMANGSVIWKSDSSGGKKTIAFRPKSMGTDEIEVPTNPEWTLGRINNMGLRWVGKLFLSHLWEVWRDIEGLPTRPPYPIEYQKHTTYIDPWEMVESEKPATS